MKKYLISVIILFIIITIFFCGCNEKSNNTENEIVNNETIGGETFKNYTIPPEITLTFNPDIFDVYNVTIETMGYTVEAWEKIGNGFLGLFDNYNYCTYNRSYTFKNVAEYPLDDVRITENFYDSENNFIYGGTTYLRIYDPICIQCVYPRSSGMKSTSTNWEKIHHMDLIFQNGE